MDLEELIEKCKIYNSYEGRASFYGQAIEIVEQYPVQAAIIILATWNVARFRYVVSEPKNLHDLIDAVHACLPILEKLKGKSFAETNFDEIENEVKQLYSTLSKVKGAEYTGGSKVLHILNRNLFVIWDSYIRKKYGYNVTANDYFRFLKYMQSRFAGIEWTDSNKTLAKAIDEYNYVTISVPEVEKIRSK